MHQIILFDKREISKLDEYIVWFKILIQMVN